MAPFKIHNSLVMPFSVRRWLWVSKVVMILFLVLVSMSEDIHAKLFDTPSEIQCL